MIEKSYLLQLMVPEQVRDCYSCAFHTPSFFVQFQISSSIPSISSCLLLSCYLKFFFDVEEKVFAWFWPS
jgi:hypothetical protein